MANYCYKVMFATLVLGLIAFLIVNVRQHVLAQGQLKLVRTKTGPVRGERRIGTLFESARPYYAFRGIPYADPPIGLNRFKAAQPVRPWKAVRSCYEHAAVCLQMAAGGKRELIGSEDCLYMNVYTPDVDPPAEQARAVLVWLPGNDWHTGSGNVDELGPEFLVEHDVIVVTLNNRLGVLGFLNLDTGDVAGNQALGDQLLALEWIRENINAFGGDPERVTLGGVGTGSIAVHMHAYAEPSARMFRRAIMMGTSPAQWHTYERPTVGVLRAELLALVRKPLVTRRVNNADLVNELQAIDAGTLVEAFGQRTHAWLGPSLQLANVEVPFLRGVALDWRMEYAGALEAGANWTTALQVLGGYANASALPLAAATFEAFRHNVSGAGASTALPFRAVLQHALRQRRQRQHDETVDELWSRVVRQYVANETDVQRVEYVRLLTDLMERYLVDRRLRFLAARSSGAVYRYRFALDTQVNMVQRWTSSSNREYAASLEGEQAAHGDAVCYVFRCEALDEMYRNVTVGTKVYAHIAEMSREFALFVKSGTTSRWQPMQAPRFANGTAGEQEWFVDISSAGWRQASGDFAEERAFWDSVFEK